MKALTTSRMSCLTTFLSLIMLFTTACDKEKEDESAPDTSETAAPCMVLEERKSSLTRLNDRTATMEYDAKGQLTSTTYTSGDEPELVDRYQRNPAGKISKLQTYYGAKVIWEMDFEYDLQGKWMRATTSNNGGVIALIEYEHDSQGNITKTTRTIESYGKTETSVKTYEYTNGNLVRMVHEYDNGYGVDHFAYEYYLDKPAFPLEYDNIFTPTQALGTPSKNLLKRITHTMPAEEDLKGITDFTYKLNEAGMPTRTTSTYKLHDDGTFFDYSPDSLVVTRSYRCE